ncbi:MAG: hypothetical protein ACE5KM_05235 [Planctomycetaceae bacterium]
MIPIRRQLSFPIVAAAMFVAVFAVDSDARASCGDYLYSPGTAQQESQEVSSAKNIARRPAAPFRLPCHGPGCRKAPIVPLNTGPPVPPVRVDTHLFATASGASESPAPVAERRGFRKSGGDNAGHPRRIDRPPRRTA